MEIKHLSKSEFDQAVNAGDDLVIVDFFATWCGPCKMLSPVVERMADKYGDVHFYKVDIDEEIDLGAKAGIKLAYKSVFTPIFTSDGQLPK